MTQLAIRLPEDLLRDLDWLVIRMEYSSRTEAMRETLLKAIDAERRREIGEKIAEGYRRIPQTDDEVAQADFHFREWQKITPDEDWEGWL